MKCFGCSKGITTPKNCSLCENIFCSNSCIEAHQISYHRTNKTFMSNLNFYQPKKPETKSDIFSTFITKGKIFLKIKYDPLYRLENFFQLKDKNNKPRILGSGSYGQVYLCLNKYNKKCYAIKHMDKSCLKQTLKTLSGIYTEIDLQSRISHPNIVQLLYVQESQLAFDLVMDLANYGSLFEYIRKNKCLSEETSFKYFIQVVNAIYFLHQNDLIHRDIKPENLLLYDNNIIKLCDFGWCVGLNGGQRGTFCGTTEYMAPEMVNQKVYSKEIDIWSLGVLLYEMLHGHSPFIPNKLRFDEREVMENIKIHNLKFDQKVSQECKELICHLLDENRKSRYKIEDIFNSNFVKKYEKQLLNKIEVSNINNKEKFIYKIYYGDINIKNNLNNKIEKKISKSKWEKLKIEDDKLNNNNIHSKCISNINTNNGLNTNHKRNDDENEEKNRREKTENNNKMSKTENYFHQNKLNKTRLIETPRKISRNEINNKYNPQENNFENKINNKEKLEQRNNTFQISEKEKENRKDSKQINIIYENPMKIKQIEQNKGEDSHKKVPLEDNDKESSIINNYSIETENNNSNKNIHNSKSNNKISEYIKNNNGKIMPMIKKCPIDKGHSSVINMNSHLNNKNKNVKDNIQIQYKINFKNVLNKNHSNNNFKKKGLSQIEESIINTKNKSPIKIISMNNNNENQKNSNSKIKQKQKEIKINRYIYSNDINNRTQFIGMKNNHSFLEPSLKTRNYSDSNNYDFKNTPEKEFLSNNPDKNGLSFYNSNDINEIYYYFIINNNNNIISSNLNDPFQNKKAFIKKGNISNNLIFCNDSKITKTPVKKNTHKNLIKIEKGTIDNDDDSKVEIHHKSKIKSKSCIKAIIKKDINEQRIKNSNNEANCINIFPLHKPKILDKEKKHSALKTIIESLVGENNSTYNSRDINENNIEAINKESNENNVSLNKTIKIKINKKEIDENKNNNSFNGPKTIKKIKENDNKNKGVSPYKIIGYENKKIEKKNDLNVTESSKIIDEREFGEENYDDSEDDMNKTPKKNADKVKIIPCKLIDEITKKVKKQ